MNKINKILFTISSILVSISLYLSVKISYSVPQFEEMFILFDASLSNETRGVLKYHYFGLLAPILALVSLIYIFKVNTKKILKNTAYGLSVIAFILTLTWQAYTVNVLYTPIIEMGEE